MKDNVSPAKVGITREGECLVFTLDNPQAGNEITGAMFDDMLHSLRSEAASPMARVLRIRANGDVFCRGRERAGRDASAIRTEVARLIALKQAVRETSMISIAEVQGDAAGFGIGLAVLCDFTLVADHATLCFPEMRKGLPPAAIMAYLGHYALPKHAFGLILLADDFSPAYARDIGLVTEVCPREELTGRADALAERILAMDAEGARQCKAYFLAAQGQSLESNFRQATDLLTVQTLRLQAQQP
ncbi:enoyl-CoA hydratase/isomerase family protein [Dyella sp.]|uniref:enoyl-CoA hydratase/isomerase family protein n=1 Tax=Dyella sp. TaxID=1869338 RepID=UPI002ED63CED